jgi:hypothetical protein
MPERPPSSPPPTPERPWNDERLRSTFGVTQKDLDTYRKKIDYFQETFGYTEDRYWRAFFVKLGLLPRHPLTDAVGNPRLPDEHERLIDSLKLDLDIHYKDAARRHASALFEEEPLSPKDTDHLFGRISEKLGLSADAPPHSPDELEGRISAASEQPANDDKNKK